MSVPAFKLPALDAQDSSTLNPPPEQLVRWLASLPLINSEQAAEDLVEVMRAYNQSDLMHASRMQAVEASGRVAAALVQTLSHKFRDSNFPLSHRNSHRYSLVDRLYAEWVLAYKLVLSEIDPHAEDADLFAYIPVLANAMELSVSRLLVNYAAYHAEPEGLWRDVHQMYSVAEHLYQSTSGRLNDVFKEPLEACLHAYRRILLLAVANPYHLMQSEAHLLFEQLNSWSNQCEVVPLKGYLVEEGDLLINLETDGPPGFILDVGLDEPGHTRTIDMRQLLQRFNQTVKDVFKKQSLDKTTDLSFHDRTHRDMLLRLKEVWTQRRMREMPRKDGAQSLYLTIGLAASHFFIDGEQDFFPERDEFLCFRPGAADHEWTLVPLGFEPWRADHQDGGIALGIDDARISRYDDDDDVWKRLCESGTQLHALREQQQESFVTHEWKVINHSRSGIGLSCGDDVRTKVRVGNLISFQVAPQDTVWLLGVVRWMKSRRDGRFEVGVKVLHGKPEAVAVRGSSGAGQNSEYFRTLIVKQAIDGAMQPVLFVPAAIFDCGSQLLLNTKNKLQLIQLTELLRTTSSFSEFRFDVIETKKDELAEICSRRD